MRRGACADVTLSAWGRRSLGLGRQVGKCESKGHSDPPFNRG